MSHPSFISSPILAIFLNVDNTVQMILMFKEFRFSLPVVLGLILSIQTIQSAVLGNYTFQGPDEIDGVEHTANSRNYTYGDLDPDSGDTLVPTHPNVTFGQFEFHNVGGYSWPDLISPNGWSTESVMNVDEFLQFVITPAAGYYLVLESISFNHLADHGQNAQQGPNNATRIFLGDLALDDNPGHQAESLFTSPLAASGEENIAADLALLAATTHTFDFADFQTGVGESVTVRFYGWNNEQNWGVLALDNVTINGSVVPVPEPVHIALGVFGSIYGGVHLARRWRQKRLGRIE